MSFTAHSKSKICIYKLTRYILYVYVENYETDERNQRWSKWKNVLYTWILCIDRQWGLLTSYFVDIKNRFKSVCRKERITNTTMKDTHERLTLVKYKIFCKAAVIKIVALAKEYTHVSTEKQRIHKWPQTRHKDN